MEIREINIKTNIREQIVDITHEVEELIKESKVINGYCIISIPHTTAGITINENADPAVKRDILNILDNLIPLYGDYEHIEGNSAAHVKAILTGFSQIILIENKTLKLGTWQGVYFCEYDGPRDRKVYVKIISD